MIEEKNINIEENTKIILVNDSKILHYIKNKFDKAFRIQDTGDRSIISAHNVIGVIRVGNITYRFHSKIDKILAIFRMIEKITSSKFKFKIDKKFLRFDPKQKIRIDNGESLLLQLVDILINELFKVRNIGYTKSYRPILDNLYFLRGKVDINKQIKQNIIPKKFYCTYNELNFITYENLIIYKTLCKILDTLMISKKQRENLIMFRNELDKILSGINPMLLEKKLSFNKTRANAYYEDIIDICEMFLESNFYSTTKVGEHIFCNFVVNIEVVFERYLFLLLKELIDEYYEEYEIREQVNINVFKKTSTTKGLEIEKGYLNMVADIVIYEQESNTPVTVIDTKYIDITGKQKLDNYAYYQTISYMLGLFVLSNNKPNVSGVLLTHGEGGNSYKINYDENNYMPLYTKSINILGSESALKLQLTNMLDELLLDN